MFVHFHSLFGKPRETVKDALKESHLGVAIFLVLIPALITLAQMIVWGVSVNPNSAAIGIIKSVIGWIAISILFYAGLFLVKGKNAVKSGFGGIATAWAVAWIYLAILGAVMLLLGPLAYSPGYSAVIKIGLNENLSQASAAELATLVQTKDIEGLDRFASQHLFTVDEINELKQMAQAKQEFVNLSVFAVIGVLALILFLYAFLVIPYLIISETANSGFLVNFILYLALMAVSGIVGNLAAGYGF